MFEASRYDVVFHQFSKGFLCIFYEAAFAEFPPRYAVSPELNIHFWLAREIRAFERESPRHIGTSRKCIISPGVGMVKASDS